jgi:hypothetical protein
VHDPIVLEVTRQPDVHLDQMRTVAGLGDMEKPRPRRTPNRAVARLRERIDRMGALPIIASDACESRAVTHGDCVECKKTLIDTDEVTVAAGLEKGPDSGRTQTVVAAKRHGDLAIEPYEPLSGAEPYESALIALNALQLVARQAVCGREGADRQPFREQQRHGAQGHRARNDRRAKGEECRQRFVW